MASADDEGVIAKVLMDVRSAGKDLDERALERMEALMASWSAAGFMDTRLRCSS
ncbi:hypothetical protein [Rhizobium binxianense]